MARIFTDADGNPAPITFTRAEDVTIPFAVKVSDASGAAAQDITGWAIVFTVARAQNSKTKLIQKTCSTTSAAAGTCSAAIASADSADIEPGNYYGDVWRTDSGAKRKLAYGRVVIEGAARVPTE